DRRPARPRLHGAVGGAVPGHRRGDPRHPADRGDRLRPGTGPAQPATQTGALARPGPLIDPEHAIMSLHITPLSPALGAIVVGIDLRQPLGDADQQAIERALLEHQVLFFRAQPIEPKQQAAFAARFGDLHIHPIYPNIPEQPEVLVLDTAVTDVRDNAIWHTDVTFLETPALGAVLAAKQLPAHGGDTLWASSSAAYEALSEPLQRLLDGLSASHDFTRSFPLERFGNTPEALEHYHEVQRRHPPVSHPVVRTHPVTGRKRLSVNEGFTTRINELE